jgi:hypothetical protein
MAFRIEKNNCKPREGIANLFKNVTVLFLDFKQRVIGLVFRV